MTTSEGTSTPDRYAQLRRMPWWDQERVATGRAVVVGCGALGNEVIKNLALIGWGTVVAVDFDVVELSNLTRSLFFRPVDCGELKAEVVARRARELREDVSVVPLPGRVEQVLSAGMLARCDVVFGCVDTVEARIAISRMAGLSGTLYVDGGLSPWAGAVSVFRGGEEACYCCGLTREDYEELSARHSCPVYAARAAAEGGVPTTPTLASVVGATMAHVGVQWLHGLRPDDFRSSREFRFDYQSYRCWTIRRPLNPECPLHLHPVRPLRNPVLEWTRSWGEILDAWRDHFGDPGLSLRLPVPVGDSGQAPGTAAAGTRELRPGVPWSDQSPRSMGFAPWSWLEGMVSDHDVIVELQGVSGPLACLQPEAEG